MENTCKTCKWMEVYDPNIEGRTKNFFYCHRHAPEFFCKNDSDDSGWPSVERNHFCGDWKTTE